MIDLAVFDSKAFAINQIARQRLVDICADFRHKVVASVLKAVMAVPVRSPHSSRIPRLSK